MIRSRAYKRCEVKQVDRAVLMDRAVESGNSGTVVGLDVSKAEIVACVRWPDGRMERPWSVRNPSEIGILVELVQEMKSACESVKVGLESTGTYGEAVRRALTLAGIEVHRVSGKAASDYKEIFDGVASQHDGKDAAVIAELLAFGKCTPWPFQEDSPSVQAMKHQVDRLDAYRTQQVQWLGRLEGLLAAHWPELSELLELGSVTLLKLLEHYRGPARLLADAGAARQLSRWGGTKLTASKIEQVLESARTTRGVPPNESRAQWLSEVAGQALAALRQLRSCERELERLVAAEPGLSRYVSAVGASTLAVLMTSVGDPRSYASSGAFLKALGLNLKELSSGRRQGQLAISKRGPSRVRRWIFFWALRGVQRAELKPWYEQFTRVGGNRPAEGQGEHRKMKGVVALMRKLCRGLWHAMKHEEDFDYAKLIGDRAGVSPCRRRRRRRRRVVQCAAQAAALKSASSLTGMVSG